MIIIGVLLFELIIFIHEFGHFIAAKKCGVKVNEFSLGMGPRLFGFTKGETKYSFRLFPIGGYCALEGEDGEPTPEDAGDKTAFGEEQTPEPAVAEHADAADALIPAEEADAAPETASAESPEEQTTNGDPRAFCNAKVWKRMIIIVAGAVMNILLGLVLMFVTLLPKDSFAGTQVSMSSPLSWSSVTGLRPGDKIVRINGYDVNTSTDFSFALFTLPVSEVDGSELAVYKEDCAYDLYQFALNSMTEQTTQETNLAVGKMLRDTQLELCSAKDKDAAYRVFCTCYDKIAQALDVKVEEFPDVTDPRAKRQRYRTDMTVIRDGERVELSGVDLLTTAASEDAKPQVNIDFYVEPIEKNFGSLISQTFAETVSNVRMVWGSVVGLVTGRFSLNEMSGPVGIAAAITDVASQSLKTEGFGSAVMSIVYVMMIITVNLGIVNMLPFPALDGGRFLMLLIEAIFRKRVPAKVERIINAVGLVLLLGLSAVIAVKDIIKLVVGG